MAGQFFEPVYIVLGRLCADVKRFQQRVVALCRQAEVMRARAHQVAVCQFQFQCAGYIDIRIRWFRFNIDRFRGQHEPGTERGQCKERNDKAYARVDPDGPDTLF